MSILFLVLIRMNLGYNIEKNILLNIETWNRKMEFFHNAKSAERNDIWNFNN